jgi:hypothetical protein
MAGWWKKKERRKKERFPVDLAARCMTEAGSESKHCKVSEISRDDFGVRLKLQEEVHVGEILSLEMPIPKQSETIHFTVNVRWTESVAITDDVYYVAGCSMQEIDPGQKRLLLEYAYGNWFKRI